MSDKGIKITKIEDKNTILVEEIEPGECFTYPPTNELWMVLQIYVSHKNSRAINLKYASKATFEWDEDDMVTPAKITEIKYKDNNQ